MNGIISLLNVGDGDAIIISLNKEDKDLVIVIDGGKTNHYLTKVKPKLKKILKEYNKKAPDIVVATHYDSDHIGGLIPLIEDYIDGISEVWVHNSPNLIKNEVHVLEDSPKLYEAIKNNTLFVNKIINENINIEPEAIRSKSRFLIESLKQLESFIDKIPPQKLKQVYHGYSFNNWPEIKVLGPTEEFYRSLFPPKMLLEQLIIEETIDHLSDENLEDTSRFWKIHGALLDPCQRLKKDKSTRVTPTNKASIIIAVDNGNKRFLFTGDAGVVSFKEIPDWKTELKDIYWLKIPHHGSDNNISTEIIDVMKPKYADNSGDRYQDNHVLSCIGRNKRSEGIPRSTKMGKDLIIKI